VRIVIATDTFLPNASGVVRACLNLGSALATAGHQVAVLAPRSRSSAADRPQVPFHVVDVPARMVRPAGLRPVVTRKSAHGAAAELLSDFAPDVVHVHSPWAIGQTSLRQAFRGRLPTVLTVHLTRPNAVNHTLLAGVVPDLTWAVVRRAYRECAEHSDLITAPSYTGRRHALSLFGDRAVDVVSNGVSPLPRLPYVPRGDEPVRLLYVGRLSKEKNIDALIRAVASRALRQRVHLRIVGSGTQTRSLRRLIRRSGAPVSLEGALSDFELARRYAATDIFCMPSRAELECIAALEALSYGLPIVAPRGSALDEMQQWSGAVWLYEEESEVAQTISKLIDHPELRFTLQQSAKAASDTRSLETIATQWTRIYSDLASAQFLPPPDAGRELRATEGDVAVAAAG
jgi:1,2-diacylglycerol 3-alpha-glucosyltransferase